MKEDAVSLVEAARDLGDVGRRRPERPDRENDSLLRVDVVSASVDIKGPVAELRPGVGGDVGFRDDDDAADAVRRETVEGDRPDVAPAISAALTRICWTFSMLPMMLGSQPEASTI